MAVVPCPVHPELVEGRTDGLSMDARSDPFDYRAFRFGTVLGGLALLAALGAFKNFMALFSGEREGYVLFSS
jgi:hypothetical protein